MHLFSRESEKCACESNYIYRISRHISEKASRGRYLWIFFLKCFAQRQQKITHVLCVTIIISSYVIQHRNPAWILAQQINQRSLWSRWAKERSSNAKTVASSEIPLWLHLQSGTWLLLWGWWEYPTLFWSHTKIKVKRFMSFSFLASRKEIQVREPGDISCVIYYPPEGTKTAEDTTHLPRKFAPAIRGRWRKVQWKHFTAGQLESLDAKQFLSDSADITGMWGPPDSFQKRYF